MLQWVTGSVLRAGKGGCALRSWVQAKEAAY
jgi:hypothetical protein